MEEFKRVHLKMMLRTVFIVPLAMFGIIYFATNPADRASLNPYTHMIATMFGAIAWMLIVHFMLPAGVKKQEKRA